MLPDPAAQPDHYVTHHRASPVVDVADPATGRLADGPVLIIVRNDEDSDAMRRYLKRTHDVRFRHVPTTRTLVRPTPGARDRATLARDLLTAVGKNPETLDDDRLGGTVWNCAYAWLRAAGTTDLLVDRAHQLDIDRLADLADMARWLSCRVWLIWSGEGELSAPDAAGFVLGIAAGSISADLLPTLLPLPAPESVPVPWRAGPALPAAEFTTFRAACRRELSDQEFARVDQLYLDAAHRADAWMVEHAALRDSGGPESFGTELVAWLRDVHLGPCASADTALVTLRATQAALLIRGVLLRWTPAALGPDPADQLRGTLRERLPHDLYAGARTADAAITMLSLHLNQPPWYFACWRVGHVTQNGAILCAPADAEHHHDLLPRYLEQPDYRSAVLAATGVLERACDHAIQLPPPAQVILAAHHAYRRREGAHQHDPLFAGPTPGEHTTVARMRETALRTATRRLRQLPPWLHRDPCRFGGDIGGRERVSGWLVERNLSVHLLPPRLAEQLHHPLRHRGEL